MLDFPLKKEQTHAQFNLILSQKFPIVIRYVLNNFSTTESIFEYLPLT